LRAGHGVTSRSRSAFGNFNEQECCWLFARQSAFTILFSLISSLSVLQSISVPELLQRNSPNVRAAGIEHSGETLLRHLARRLGRPDLGGLDLLDIGCGVRFTQTLINRSLPFKSYTGIEVCSSRVQWLQQNVENKDERFSFIHWNVHNAMYNKKAPQTMSACEHLPTTGTYDIIMGFSLFTHLAPEDAAHLLRLTRKVLRPGGYLFFSAFCDESVHTFEDRVPEKSVLNAYYQTSYLKTLIEDAGWQVVSYEEPAPFIMSSFLCRPATS
jgi:SAM-dependent methyltransferase